MEEIYKPIPNFPNYEISNMGNVKSIKTGNLLRQENKRPYVRLYAEKQQTNRYIDELVCAVHLDFYHGQTIKHFDGNIKNNSSRNLSFSTEYDGRDFIVYHEKGKGGECTCYSTKTNMIFTMKHIHAFPDQWHKFELFKQFHKRDEDGHCYADGNCLSEFAGYMRAWNKETSNNDIYKINYTNFYRNSTAVSRTLDDLINEDMLEKMEDITYDESCLVDKCNNGGLQYLNPEYKNNSVGCFGVDFSANYPTAMNNPNFLIPTNKPTEQTLTELPEELQLGIYRVKISCANDDFKKVFAYSADHHYTNIDINLARKCQKRFNVKIELIKDEKPNAFVHELFVTGDKIFSKWYGTLIQLKRKFPKNGLVKHLLSSAWGQITQMKRVNVNVNDKDKLNEMFNDPSYEMIELFRNNRNEYYQFVPVTGTYKYNLRIKQFLTAYTRSQIAEVILDGDNIDYFVRVQTDGVVFTKQIDYKKFPGLQIEDKTTGFIHWQNVNRYDKIFHIVHNQPV